MFVFCIVLPLGYIEMFSRRISKGLVFFLHQRYNKHLRTFSKFLDKPMGKHLTYERIWCENDVIFVPISHPVIASPYLSQPEPVQSCLNKSNLSRLNLGFFISLSGTMMLRMWPVIFWVPCGSSPSPFSPLDMETWCLTPTVARECVCSQELWYKHTYKHSFTPTVTADSLKICFPTGYLISRNPNMHIIHILTNHVC